MTYPNQLFSAFSFVGFVLCAIPLYWHLKAGNVGTCLYMAWAGLGCLNDFINSVVWNSTTSNVAPVWCDISTRFQTGFTVGLPAAMIVINHRLFKIVSKSTASTTNARAEKCRALFIDLAIGLGIPLLQMALQIIVEGHRFDIFEEIGCIPNTSNVTLMLPLVLIWAPIMSVINALYSCVIIRLFWKNSQQFKGMLGPNRNHNQNRYIRLIALSCTQVFVALPISLYVICFTSQITGFRPWISWSDTHSHYSHINQYPSLVWRAIPDVQVVLELTRWLAVFSAFLFFAFFGFAEEARKHYRLAYTSASGLLRPSSLDTSRANRNSTRTLTSSFVPRSRKPSAVSVGPPLRSHSRPGTMKECDESTLVSDYRLAPDSSVFEGVHDEPKAVGFLPDEDDRPISPATQTDVVLPTISRAPVPPLPTADSDGAVPSIPPDRINFSHPRRLTSICASVHSHSDRSPV